MAAAGRSPAPPDATDCLWVVPPWGDGALGLLPNTVKSYLKTAMRKLDARNRVQAITAAREAGLIH